MVKYLLSRLPFQACDYNSAWPLFNEPSGLSSTISEVLTLLSFSTLIPSNTLHMLPMLDLQQLSKCWVFQTLCTSSNSSPCLLLLRLTTETSNSACALFTRIPQQPYDFWVNENKCLTIEPSSTHSCRWIQLHSMQESSGSDKETIETYSLLSQTSIKKPEITCTAYSKANAWPESKYS